MTRTRNVAITILGFIAFVAVTTAIGVAAFVLLAKAVITIL